MHILNTILLNEWVNEWVNNKMGNGLKSLVGLSILLKFNNNLLEIHLSMFYLNYQIF